MTFKKAETTEEIQTLKCAMPGCFNVWTVDLGRGMCSVHQWEPRQEIRQNAKISDSDRSAVLRKIREIGQGGDKAWAYQLKARDEAGETLTPHQRKLYKEALK